jgi:UDP-2,4-diacetamido-2,4,6-trideoxy-beta-L-altropyranose hydrolase
LRVAIRADASAHMGIGHVMRCLTLAQGLQKRGASVSLLSRALPHELKKAVSRINCELFELPAAIHPFPDWLGVTWQEDAESCAAFLSKSEQLDWLIVDHYGIDVAWEQRLRVYARHILVIDDLADRSHLAEILLDPNYPDNAAQRYRDKLPDTCQILSGPRYVLLREEFVRARHDIDTPNPTHLLIQFGGSDPLDCTSLTVQAVAPFLREGITCDVVVGSSYAHLKHLQVLLSKLRSLDIDIKLHVDINNMALLMSDARLAVAGGGTSTWERCCVGLPTITIAIAENQIEPLARLHETGAVYNLGYMNGVEPDVLLQAVKAIWYDNSKLSNMAVNGRNLVDGHGLERVLDALYVQ